MVRPPGAMKAPSPRSLVLCPASTRLLHSSKPQGAPESGRLARVSKAFADADIRDLALPDGRTLRTYSAGAAAGELIVLHHGTPASGCPAAWMADDAAARGALLVGYDRPGYGGAAPPPGRARRAGPPGTDAGPPAVAGAALP